MDDKRQAGGNQNASDDHYQPWLRNEGAGVRTGTGSRTGSAARPVPLPTEPRIIVERSGDPAAPMRPAMLSADELLARPIPMTQPAPGALGLIDRLSQGIADSSAAARDAWRRGGIGEAIAGLELGQRAKYGTRALGRASHKAWHVTARTMLATGRATTETVGPLLRRVAGATGLGLRQAGAAIAENGRKLGDATRQAAGAASDAIAARTSKDAPLPESRLERLMAADGAGRDMAPPVEAAGLPLFASPGTEPAPNPARRKTRKMAPAADAFPAMATDAAMTVESDDRSPTPVAPTSSNRSGPTRLGAGGIGGGDRPWLRHPATLALGGAFLLSSGFAAGLYWTGPGVDRATTERVVHDYLLNHPEILPQAMERLQANQAAASVARLRTRIETPFSGAWAGAADGDVTLTVFTDYACTFCRASVPDIERLLREDSRLKIVFRELPILSQESEAAARLALAAARRGRYMPMHRALFESGSPDAAARTAAAERLGVAAGTAVLDDAAITRELQSNVTLARELGFDGTPSWVIGDRLLTGAVGYEQLREAIAEARAG